MRRPQSFLSIVLSLATFAIPVAGCGTSSVESDSRARPSANAPSIGSTKGALVTDLFGGNGQNGPGNFVANATPNFYGELMTDAAAATSSLTVQNATGTFANGQLVLVWQTTGIANSDLAVASGNQLPLNLTSSSVGRWEFARIDTVAGPVLNLTEPLTRAYAATGTQVIYVPEYTNVTIDTGVTLSPALAWDGKKGGVVALLANGALVNNGTIGASAAGFRGGAIENSDPVGSGYATLCDALDGFAPATVPAGLATPLAGGARKGESQVLGVFTASNGGPSLAYGKGNRGLGAGGGDCTNAGGGGGGHGARGGRGGFTWPGDGRRAQGGFGGAALVSNPVTLSFGGGGGGGDTNNPNGSNGSAGRGGGLVLVRAQSVSGSGTYAADGELGQPNPDDGAGGGGAGGTVVLSSANALACASVSVAGGRGNTGGHGTPDGSSGGGGGGRAHVFAASLGTCPVTATGGLAGGTDAEGGFAGPAPNGLLPANAGTCLLGLSDDCSSGVCTVGDGRCGLAMGASCVANFECRIGVCGSDLRCGVTNGNVALDAAQCRSGVRHSDGRCGLPNGTGTCASGAVCRSTVCDPTANGGTGLCRECTAGDLSNCTIGAPLCDATSFACVACNGDNGTVASATCPSLTPYCPGAGGACTTCGVAGDTATCTAGGATHAGGICQVSGACGNTCLVDTNCLSAQWCENVAGTCTADLANGTSIPTVALHVPVLNGVCTVAAASAVCASGVCDTRDNACGYDVGQGPCTGSPSRCRSNTCSTDGTCMPSGGCNVDGDCASTDWCNASTHVCSAKAAAAAPIPSGGTCSSGTSNRCLSGVCESDNLCGLANGSGGCTLVNAAGALGRCRSAICDPAANAGAGLCRECVPTNTTNCSGATSVCDSITNACVACNGDNGTVASATCPTLAPYCPGNGSACSTCGTTGGTTTCTASGATHAGGVCQATGACSNACVTDSNCTSAQWCDAVASTCAVDIANGLPVPTSAGHTPTLDGTCTTAVGAIVCATGVCDTADDLCGLPNGTGPCLGNTVRCRSGACSTNDTCMPSGGCNTDGDCATTDWCNTAINTCVAKAATGSIIPASGTCSNGVSSRCASGVCDADNICGHANGQGSCTPGNASGVSGNCRSGVCDAAAANGGGLCRECVGTDTSNCAGAASLCDSATFTCVTCNGDDGTAATAACPSSAPYCAGNGAACGTCMPPGSATPCTASGATHAGGLCQSNGACASACVGDSNCLMTQFCDTGATPAPLCRADVDNGVAIPTVTGRTNPVIDGTCTASVATIVCVSGVCDSDNACGYRDGTGPCTTTNGAALCRSGACSTDGTCMPTGGCNVDADCGTNQRCDGTKHCVAFGGPSDGGVDGSLGDSGADGGVRDATADGAAQDSGSASDSGNGGTADATTGGNQDAATTGADAAPNGTSLEGGGFSCSASPAERGSFGGSNFAFAGLALVSAAWVRRRRAVRESRPLRP